ncbi:MAG: cyd operon YbgE family protein [Dechloromonas sp.]|nr:cyd operon YbgE family protein [Dechloromonas sp.]
MTPPTDRPSNPGLAWWPLGLALLILVALTLLPGLATDSSGRADHTAATLLFATMSAGFVRGVGFIPHNLPGRILLSGQATLIFALLAALRLMQIGRLPAIF